MTSEPIFGACSKCASDEISHVWETVNVPLGHKSYDILIGPGLLSGLGTMLKEFLPDSRFVLITDSTVEDYLGVDLLNLLQDEGIDVSMISFPAGEESKRMDVIVDLARKMVNIGADRTSVVLALGGGVTGDMAGFLASIYMRGIPFIQIPTTLLAQVDSSVGGKTGVDLPEGKNLLGTFSQPLRVYADIGVLCTLPAPELRNGLAEVIKYGMIWSEELFSMLEERWWDVINLEPHVTAEIVKQSCEIKAKVVAEDEREGGLRRILNFGHTIGHAIEASSDYRIPHGEAVAMGMMAVSRISAMRGMLSDRDVERLAGLLDRFSLPRTIPEYIDDDSIIRLIQHDKKVKEGRVHFVLCKGIGSTVITDDVTSEDVIRAVNECRDT